MFCCGLFNAVVFVARHLQMHLLNTVLLVWCDLIIVGVVFVVARAGIA